MAMAAAASAATSSPPAKPPHALVFPYPAQGHVSPLMQLAKQLALRGFTVTFLNTQHLHPRVIQSHAQSQQLLPAAQEQQLDIRFAQISDGLPPDFDRFAGGNIGPLSQAVDNMEDAFSDLVQELLQADPPLSCIFSDMFALFTQDVANKFGLPRVAVWLQSAASYSISLYVPLLIREGHMPIKGKSDYITCIPGHPPLAPTDLPSFYQVDDMSDFMLQFKIRPFARIKEAAFVLANSFYDLEGNSFDALQQDHTVLGVGPLLPPAFLGMEGSVDKRTGTALWQEDTECEKWLDKQAACSVLYIAFGSIVYMPSVQFIELALGLQASQKPLLWVIRPDFMDSIAADLPPGLLKGGEERIYIASWAPQALVLSHPSVGAFLTHCGWNSTLEGVSMGVPMLGWPLFSEQWLNRRWVVEEWRTGMKFEAGEDGIVSKDEVERVVRTVMEGEEGNGMRERAIRLRDARRKAVGEGGSSFMNLDMVVKSLQQKSLTCLA